QIHNRCSSAPARSRRAQQFDVTSAVQDGGKRRDRGALPEEFTDIFCAASHALPNVDFWEATDRGIRLKSLISLARPKRFELLTPRFVVWCSIQLSYGRGAS